MKNEIKQTIMHRLYTVLGPECSFHAVFSFNLFLGLLQFAWESNVCTKCLMNAVANVQNSLKYIWTSSYHFRQKQLKLALRILLECGLIKGRTLLEVQCYLFIHFQP